MNNVVKWEKEQKTGFLSIGRGLGLLSTPPERINNFEKSHLTAEIGTGTKYIKPGSEGTDC